MIGFKDYSAFAEMTDEEVDEALDMRQRMKLRQSMRKNKAKIKAGKRRAAKRTASPEKLKQRATKHARKEVEKAILKDKKKGDLSFSSRGALEKKVARKSAAVARISKKLLPQIKRDERSKRSKKKET
jgi:hypothetical protein|tara:strand:+ start:6470 stop:6853 length:384 start_codon:yes stop_codon:yes gene_type:complete